MHFYLDGNGVALLHLPGVTDGVHLSPGDGFAVGGGTASTNGPGNLPGWVLCNLLRVLFTVCYGECAVCSVQSAGCSVNLGTGTQ